MNLTNEQILLIVQVLTTEVVRLKGVSGTEIRQANISDCINQLMALVVKDPI